MSRRRDEAAVHRLVALVQACAQQGQPCPSNADLAVKLGFRSSGMPAVILRHAEAMGLVRVLRGNSSRVVSAADGSWVTAGTVTNPHWRDRPEGYVAPVRPRMAWSRAAEARLREMWGAGATGSEIGAVLGCTKDAVVSHAHRLGLPARPSPIRPASGAVQPRMDSAEALREAQARQVARPPILARPAPQPRPTPPAPATYRQCRWPLWRAGDRPDHRYCDGPVACGAYCAEHAARCYQLSRPLGDLSPAAGWSVA
jgi:hypothetical protein